MYKNIKENIRKKVVGIDIFDQPIKAIEINKGLYINESLDSFYSKVLSKYESDKMKDLLLDMKYWGNLEIIGEVFKYAYKNLGVNIFKPRIIVSSPVDVLKGRFGEIWMRMLVEVANQNKWGEVYICENYLCAALGTGLNTNDLINHKKTFFVYSTTWCTYVGVVFAGSSNNIKIINKNCKEIKLNEIIDEVRKIEKEINYNLPMSFKEADFTKDEWKKLNLAWTNKIEKEIHLAVPHKLKYEFGTSAENYKLLYANDSENCIINGLKVYLENLKDIRKTLK